MDNNATAKKLAALGKREAAALRQLNAIAAERCALLTEVAQSPAAGLDADTVPTVIEPKED